ncbi:MULTISPECIES: hypothetical protein [unclassified Leptolyngbya]|uniref:hypothetical protein n=1 Tax=unclassified Leptolyngbya TaxID=2650499 RepID=UPI00168356BC|nr:MULTISPECIES: hypothetical protein [unclassified Leptolyngbya]MBD1912362.1 hypothetical protein [Leptolyngbya sp. FACHB-8]MBD2158002.1 hypothetical protein [Leptolyngbya sp. FACHB-16]
MFTRPVVVLQAAGNRHIGVGHLSRTATLAQALLKTSYWHRVLVIWEAPPELVEHFAPKGCEVLGVEDRETALDWRSLLAPPGTYAVLITDLMDLEDKDFQAARDEGYRLLVHLNDSASGRFSADMIVDEDSSKSTADLPASFEKAALIGSPYRVIRESVRDLRPEQPWQDDRLRCILVTLGGADPANLTLNFLQRLRPLLDEADLEVTAIAGPAFHPNHRYHLQNLAQKEPRIRLLNAPSSLAELIVEHDLTITLGGITSYEVMCLGRPCGAIAWENMAPYVEPLAALDLLENLGAVEQAADTLRSRLMDPARLSALASKGWQTIDGQGGDRIVQQILQRVQS